MRLERMFADKVTAIGEALGLEGRFLVEYGFEQIMAKLLPPPPEMETVEVERWAAYWPDGVLVATFDTEELAVKAISNDVNARVAKLTGHFQRPKPVKVERSATAEVCWHHCNGFTYPVAAGADWEVLVGKTGILTFTWQE